MGGDIEPSLGLILLGLVGGCLALPFIPMYWIITILNALKKMVLREESVDDALKEMASNIGKSAAAPFFFIFFSFLYFFIKTGRAIGEISQLIWGKRPKFSVPVLWQRPRDIQDGDGESECNPLFKKSYQYHPLDGKYEIRLLTIYPGSFDDPLQGEISTANLVWRPAFDALSYTWADETGDVNRSRIIECMKDGGVIQITKNCETALQRLRLRNKKRRLWIDAVCINQESDKERNQQVSLMSRIYVTARHVIAYTGEGTAQTDRLLDWINGLDQHDLNIPSMGKFQDINVANLGMLSGPAQLWNGLGATKVWINEAATKSERFWNTIKARYFSPPQDSGPHPKIVLSDAEVMELVSEYFSRRWFKRVWVLQEIALPALHKTSVVCGTKITTAERALHLLSLLKNQDCGTMIRIFVLLRQRKEGLQRSYLLDILVETRDRECADPRDKIYGVLSISRGMDKGKFPELEAEYNQKTVGVYVFYSSFFIKHHGPGFFLSLIKHPNQLAGLPSWAADWTIPWPNYNAVRGIDFAAASRPANDRDTQVEWGQENGCQLLKLHRPRILRGFFTRGRHVDDSDDTDIEDVQHLHQDEILIEMYPGMAALLKKTGMYYSFIRTCPHALTVGGVEDLAQRWSRVVVNGEGPEEINRITRQGAKKLEYLSSPHTFKIC